MPSDSELRRRFQEGTQPRGEIDVDAVLRRARSRRRPRVVLAGAGSVLAIAAIAVPAALSSTLGGGATGTSYVAEDAPAPEAGAGDSAGGGAVDETALRPSAEKLNLCTAPVADSISSTSGLVITVTPVTAPADSPAVPVTVTLTNDGTQQIFGTTGSRPSLTLSHDGITIWHTNGPTDLSARIVDLGPGESMTYETSFEPRVCGVEDDAGEMFRDDLPSAGPGTYLLSAVIEVTHDDGTTIDLVGGPAAAVTLN